MATEVSINRTRIQTFFNDLENRKAMLTTITELHKTLTNQLTKIDQTLNAKSEALDSKIKAFSENTKNALENFRNRESAIPDRESSLEKRVVEKKAVAIAEIERTEELGDLRGKSLAEALRVYCRRMHAGELVRFLVAKRTHQTTLKVEMPAAVLESVDAMRLILDAVEEFVRMKVENTPGIADTRWACSLVVQSVVLVKEVVGAGRSLRERAAEVLERWKGVLDSREGTSGAVGTEADMFLQMVSGFGLKEKFDDEFLKKLVVDFATRKDMPKIAAALGFGEKLVDIIDELVKSGKEIEAVYFASESGLTEQFPPVSLLKSSLRNCRKNANNISKKGNFTAAAVEKANNLELDAVKAIVKCVEDHKLEMQFTIDDLKKRIKNLEKAKAEKKITATSTCKRPQGSKGSSVPSSRPPKSARFSNESSSFHHKNPSQLPQVPPTRYSGPYNYVSSGVCEGPVSASYGPGYGGAQTQSPVALPQHYAYMSPDVGGSGFREAGAYGVQGPYGGQSNYGRYDYGAASHTYPPSYPAQPSDY